QSKGRREQRLGGRFQFVAFAEVDYKQAIICSIRKIPQHKTVGSKDGAINSMRYLLAKSSIFAAQLHQVHVEIVKLAIRFPLGEIQRAVCKRGWIKRRRYFLFVLRISHRGELC